MDEVGFGPEDEVRFGPSRETRPPSRRRRALVATFSTACLAAAGVALATHAPGAYHALASQYTTTRPAAPSAAPVRLPSPGCRPAHPAWPNLAGLPAGMRPGALPVIADAQFSGRCS
jgi:hypothetical protein